MHHGTRRPTRSRIAAIIALLAVMTGTRALGSPGCPPDFDNNGVLQPADISLFVSVWFNSLNRGTLEGDWDHNGAIEPADSSLFVGDWFALLNAGGCPALVHVPIVVHRILAIGDIPGVVTNRGCRLSDSEIQAIVSGLQVNSSVFGSTAVFDYLGPILTHFSVYIPTSGSRTMTFAAFDGAVALGYFDNPDWVDFDRVNVYFVGDVQPAIVTPHLPPANAAFAGTLDPARAASTGAFANIVVNDCGFDDPAYYPVGFTPPFALNRHTLEHEMTHWLARFNNRGFPVGSSPPARTYDPGEHLTGPSAINILWVVPAGSPYALSIPGPEGDSATELGEIYDRVLDNRWNLP